LTRRSGFGAGVGNRAEPGDIAAGIELLAFDLDGTLVDSAPDLNYCLGRALESVGLPPPSEDQTRSWIGGGVEELIRRALIHAKSGDESRSAPASGADDRRHDPLAGSAEGRREVPAVPAPLFESTCASFSACYEKNLFARSRLYPDVADTLAALGARGIRLCCVTNKRRYLADALLEQAGIRDRFELVLGGDSLPEKKPSPMQLEAAAATLSVAPAAAVFIGDSDHDLKAARDAGWRFIWASYGYRRAIDAAETSLAVIDHFAELAELLPARG